ncbi:protein of unknown function (plasmid) [Cupriavidus taiwanensis]|nr:protein of unknown function [Cupriavidus taiwanensis]
MFGDAAPPSPSLEAESSLPPHAKIRKAGGRNGCAAPYAMAAKHGRIESTALHGNVSSLLLINTRPPQG